MVNSLQNIELTDGGILLYDESLLPYELADRYFVTISDECIWEQKPGILGHMQPRLTASYADDGVIYRYSATVNVALPWTPAVLEIKEKIEAAQGKYNFCLLNRYRSSQDSIGMHADDEPEMRNIIGSLSLGANRTFRIKHNKTKETMSFSVGHRTLIIMAGAMQQFWKHEIPKTKQAVEERINLTTNRLWSLHHTQGMPLVIEGKLNGPKANSNIAPSRPTISTARRKRTSGTRRR